MRVSIRVTPGVRRAKVGGRRGDHLVVKVTSRAVEGAATESALAAVAAAFGVRRRQVTLVNGETSRVKLVEVDAAPDAVQARLDELLDE